MDPQVPTSFIPKKPLVGDANSHGVMGGLFNLLALLLFLVSLLSAGGTFGYKQYLERAVAVKDESLKKAEGAFDTRAIQDLERLDRRLIEAQTLLQEHVAPSGLFAFLSSATLERVQFTSLMLDISPEGQTQLTMGGVADSFSTLALQSDQFSAAKALRDVIFSGITTNANGRVVFSVSANVDPALVSYARQQSPVSAAGAEVPSN